jgi:hypothetical protein
MSILVISWMAQEVPSVEQSQFPRSCHSVVNTSVGPGRNQPGRNRTESGRSPSKAIETLKLPAASPPRGQLLTAGLRGNTQVI